MCDNVRVPDERSGYTGVLYIERKMIRRNRQSEWSKIGKIEQGRFEHAQDAGCGEGVLESNSKWVGAFLWASVTSQNLWRCATSLVRETSWQVDRAEVDAKRALHRKTHKKQTQSDSMKTSKGEVHTRIHSVRPFAPRGPQSKHFGNPLYRCHN